MKRTGTNKNRASSTPEDRKKYQEEWSKMMVNIWKEKIERLHVVDTYQLHQEITEQVTASSSDMATIMHRFMEYGIYQDCGTGNGYTHGNGGNLDFLDGTNRQERTYKQKSGKVTSGDHRKPREWFSRAYFASVMVLKEQMAYMYGEEFCGLITDVIEKADSHRSKSMRSNLWGHHNKR